MNKPLYTAVAAITLDGKIARHQKHYSSWTSREDKVFLHKILDQSDVVIVGNKTYKLASKPLSKRNCIVFTRSIKTLEHKSKKLIFANTGGINIQKFIQKNRYKKICILGGSQIYSYFLKRNLLDEIYLTIEPIIFGKGIGLFDKEVKNVNYKLKSTKLLNQQGTILLHYIK